MKSLALILGILLLPFSYSFSEEEIEEKSQTKYSILKDLLQPLGMPLVSTYYGARENVFLNIRYANENPIEATGNALLIPYRYLFAGKNARIENRQTGDCDVKQCYTYRKFHWLKTPLAFAALPVSLVLGSTVKAIAYLSPGTRKRHKMIRESMKAPKVVSCLAMYKSMGISDFHSDEWIEPLRLARPSNIIKKHKLEMEALKAVTKILEKNNIIYWIDCGTCLGAYRYGGFIPWDDDIDLSILLPDHENVKRLLLGLDPKKYEIQDWSSYEHPNTFLKLYIKETKTLIDLYHYKIDAQNKTAAYFYTHLNSPFPAKWKKSEIVMMKPLSFETIFPLKKVNFDGVEVWAPRDIVTFLKSKYGENLEPTMVWIPETRTYQKVEGHPYWN